MFARELEKFAMANDPLRGQTVTFDNEDDALDYARKLAQLKPGDLIMLPHPDTGELHKSVFVQYDEDYTVSALTYSPAGKRIRMHQCSLVLVQLPE